MKIEKTYNIEQVLQMLFDNDIEFTGQRELQYKTVQVFTKSGCIINISVHGRVWLQGEEDEEVSKMFNIK